MLTNPARTYDYQYDAVGKLTQDKRTDRGGSVVRTTIYVYDRVGNRTLRAEITASGTTTTAYTYDANDRLTQETSTAPTGTPVVTTYAWDANGSLISKTVGGTVTVYAWNSDKLLTAVKQGANEATAITFATFVYDADGNRIKKVEPGLNGQPDKVTTYVIDSSFGYPQVVMEIVAQGSAPTTTVYTWGNGLISQSRAGQENYFHADALGSERTLTNASGNVTDTYQYDAFGNIEGRTGTTSNAYRYTGEYFDDVINAQYNRARYLNLQTGRFLSQDNFAGDARSPATLNKYVYANGNPVSFTDPGGYMSLGELAVAQDIVGIAATYARSELSGFVFDRLASSLVNGLLGGSGANVPGNPAAAAFFTVLATTCLSGKKKCLLGSIPVLVTGATANGRPLLATSTHIAAALFGYGNTQSGGGVAPFLLTRKSPPFSRSWIKRSSRCNSFLGLTTGAVGRTPGLSCDEYPYASTTNGGLANYNLDRVSLAQTPSFEDAAQGGAISKFYGKAKVDPGKPFLNLAAPYLPFSFYIYNKVVHRF